MRFSGGPTKSAARTWPRNRSRPNLNSMLKVSISKAMVDAHRGKIRVESPGKDKGATFIVELKTVAAPVGTENGADGERILVAERKTAVSRRHRLLVVDDHADTCTGMKMMLER